MSVTEDWAAPAAKPSGHNKVGPQAPRVPPNQLAATVPRFTISLDEPPETRWNHVIDIYAETLRAVLNQVDDFLSKNASGAQSVAVSFASTLLSAASHVGFVLYGKELAAIASRGKLPVGKLTAMQLVYEAFAMCTSIVGPKASDGTLAHARTMDWEMPFLRPLTAEFEFVAKGKPRYVATSWVGYVGVLTGMTLGRPVPTDNFSVSINFRPCGTGTFWTNLQKAMGRAWPVGFLVRRVLEDANSYDEAQGNFRASELIAPTYITMCSAFPGRACLITRDRTKEEHFWDFATDGVISQANIDHFADKKAPDCFTSRQRSQLGREGIARIQKKLAKEMEQYQREVAKEREKWHGIDIHAKVPRTPSDPVDDNNDDDAPVAFARQKTEEQIEAEKSPLRQPPTLGKEDFFSILNAEPVWNDLTVYGVFMDPATGTYETRLPTQEGFTPGRLRKQDVSAVQNKKCKTCDQHYDPDLNAPGSCAHSGKWHAAYSDCSTFTCGYNLGLSKIGRAHWGCCYSTNQNGLVCPKSKAHN